MHENVSTVFQVSKEKFLSTIDALKNNFEHLNFDPQRTFQMQKNANRTCSIFISNSLLLGDFGNISIEPMASGVSARSASGNARRPDFMHSCQPHTEISEPNCNLLLAVPQLRSCMLYVSDMCKIKLKLESALQVPF